MWGKKRSHEYFIYYKVFSSRGLCIAEGNIILGFSLPITEFSDIEAMQAHLKAKLLDGTIALVSGMQATEDLVSNVLVVNYIFLKRA